MKYILLIFNYVMEFLSQFDCILIGVVLFFGLIGLIRGFIKEVCSIINWVTTFYLTAFLKPILLDIFKINIPFLGDLIVNSVLFVVIIIIISLITKQISFIFKKLINTEINLVLGFCFGFIKGSLIILLLLSTCSILYKDKKNQFLENSFIFNNTVSAQNDVNSILKTLFGDFIQEKQVKVKKHLEDKKIEEIKTIIDTENKILNIKENNKNEKKKDEDIIEEKQKKEENTDMQKDELLKVLDNI